MCLDCCIPCRGCCDCLPRNDRNVFCNVLILALALIPVVYFVKFLIMVGDTNGAYGTPSEIINSSKFWIPEELFVLAAMIVYGTAALIWALYLIVIYTPCCQPVYHCCCESSLEKATRQLDETRLEMQSLHKQPASTVYHND